MKMQQETCYLFGASGHAKVVIDIVEREGRYAINGLFDDNQALWVQNVFGYQVIGGLDAVKTDGATFIVAIGHNDIRHRVSMLLAERGCDFGRALHPSASVSRGVVIGRGTVVMAGAVINADTTIGEHVIINTAASVDHDCAVGNLTHIAPGVRLCGGVSVGERALIGAGAVIIPNLRIGSDVTVGAGATVIHDVADGITVVGTPARSNAAILNLT